MKDILNRLGHKPLTIKDSDIGDYLLNKTVLVTGGGGSIGSRICKKLPEFGVSKLIIFDEYENGAYEVQQDMLMSENPADIKVVIGSITDTERVNEVFTYLRPDIIFHTAAHKHVALMEENSGEAYKNNVEGTKTVLIAAKDNGVERFIFISTDKAANPVSVMGKSKRECELMIQGAELGQMKTPIVRFGNVAGSNGSVIPLFKKQIEAGGPLTLTSPEAKRYFLMPDEAVDFIFAVGNIGGTGEIFIPDMGEAVKIEDIAKQMIKDAGKDISITYTGLRPGEKLCEELTGEGERLEKTELEGVFRVH